MPDLKGNKGEWSEIYVFFHLLGEGKIYAADEQMHRLPDSFLQVIKILREETAETQCAYVCGDNVQICINGETHSFVPAAEFRRHASLLLSRLQDTTIAQRRGSFAIQVIQRFMEQILVTKIKAPSIAMNETFGGKADITLEVLDPNSGINLPMGFSIKSEISHKPTLINASEATNFVYEVHGITDDQMDEVNAINTRNKLVDRMAYLSQIGATVDYVKPLREQTADNLLLLSESMDQVIAEALLCYFRDGVSHLDDVIAILVERNPLHFRRPEVLYQTRFKELLYASFCGLNLGKPWDGSRNINGGYIIVDADGEVLAYHTIIQDSFKNFLLSSCKLEKGSSTRHKYGTVYKEDGRYFIRLNLQIRFA